jgi:hypothetical protein
MPLWVQVGLALLVPIAALAGVWFGWYLAKTEREQQWRRDRQIDAYTELIAAGADASIAVSNRLTALTAQQHADANIAETIAQIKFHNALHRAMLVSPREDLNRSARGIKQGSPRRAAEQRAGQNRGRESNRSRRRFA